MRKPYEDPQIEITDYKPSDVLTVSTPQTEESFQVTEDENIGEWDFN